LPCYRASRYLSPASRLRPGAAQGGQRQQHPLFEEGLAGQVADDLAAQRGAADGEGGGQDQIRILGLLGVFVVRQVIGAVGASDAPMGTAQNQWPRKSFSGAFDDRPPCAASCIRMASPSWRVPITATHNGIRIGQTTPRRPPGR
jgi:hypothetical protein